MLGSLLTALLIWPIAALLVARLPGRMGRMSVGLPLAYLGGLFLIHWPGAALYLVDGYYYYPPVVVEQGFYLTTSGMVAFTLGALIVNLLQPRLRLGLARGGRAGSREMLAVDTNRLAKYLFYVGLFSYLVLQPLLGRLPTVSAIISGMAGLSVVGVCLGVWGAVQSRNGKRFRRWLLVALMFPFFTLLHAAFVGYGVHNLLTVLAFTLALVKLRPRVILAMPVLVYLGLSFYVSYMQERTEYRALAWSGQASVIEKLKKVGSMLGDFELFDYRNEEHLNLIDMRLNQNWLVGSSVRYMKLGGQDFARGESIVNAFIALIPRVIWPDKPVVAGGGDVVSRYTGLYFSMGTSVGAGQILELYANFGRYGVYVGMLVLGILIGIFDTRAAASLVQGDQESFIFWYLPSMGFLQAGGNLVEIMMTVGASFGTAMIAIFLARKYLYRNRSILGGVQSKVVWER